MANRPRRLSPAPSPTAESTQPLRVLVLGDSTAYALSEGLSKGSDGAFVVISAGVMRCPVVRAVAVFNATDTESELDGCLRFDRDWARMVDSYDVDVILNVTSLAEQWDQRYPDDPAWHVPGSVGYDAFHASELADLQRVVSDLGIPLLLADAPPLRADLDGVLGSQAERVAAWNATLTTWDASTGMVVIPYSRFFAAPESDEGYAQRPDGVHVTKAFAESMTRNGLGQEIIDGYQLALAEMLSD